MCLVNNSVLLLQVQAISAAHGVTGTRCQVVSITATFTFLQEDAHLGSKRLRAEVWGASPNHTGSARGHATSQKSTG